MNNKFSYVLILGSNTKNRISHLENGIKALNKKGKIIIRSQTHETIPYGMKNQNLFLNMGIYYETDLNPFNLLKEIKKIEASTGRKKLPSNYPRPLDIDIAWWSNYAYFHKELTIPHIKNRSRYWVIDILSELEKSLSEKIANDQKSIYFTDSLTNIDYHRFKKMAIHNINDFLKKKKNGEKITMITAYDYTMANLLSRTSIDCVLIGDSLGNVIQGNSNTIPVTLDEIIYHAKLVRKALPDTFLIADMPFLSYQISDSEAVRNAGRILKETQVDAVKLEGGIEFVETIQKITRASIPVMGHVGLTPQSVLRFGGYKVQGKSPSDKEKILNDAKSIQDAGAFGLVAEVIPESLGKSLSESLKIPVIGIGAGNHVDGQVLVIQDMLGMNPDFHPKMVRRYAEMGNEIIQSVENYCLDVRESKFPSDQETYVD